MRGFQILLQLPVSLLLLATSIRHVVAAPVADVELRQLTPDNFKSSVSNGVWLVENFSPYCGHCKAFMPTWKQLQEDVASVPDPGITLAQVNCVQYGDFCSEMKIAYYPMINLWKNGEFVETYEGSRELELLQVYIEKHAESSTPKVAPTSTEPAAVVAPTKAVEVLHVQTPRAGVNTAGTVLKLDPTNFKDVLAEGPTFIKFFAPWCGHCKKLAPDWVRLARHLQNRLTIAEVDCEEQKALCSEQGVTGFPMLVYYSNGATSEYTSSRKLDKLKEFTEKASIPAIKEIGVDELEENVKANPVVYLLIYSASDSSILNDVTQASSILLGSVPILTSSSPELHTRYSVSDPWVILAFKDHDSSAPTANYYNPNIDKAGLSRWLQANRISTSVELTVDTFQQVMNAPNKPLVVIVPVTKATEKDVSQKVRDIGLKWKAKQTNKGSREVVFAWMDAERWAKWMKTMYGIRASEEPTVVVSDHSNLVFWDVDASSQPIKLTSPSIFSALEGIDKGSIPSKSSRNFAERLGVYLNAKLTSMEGFIVNHLIFTLLVFLGLLYLFYRFLRKIMADEIDDMRNPKLRRLD
ncbi:thioredoxin-domain-containing protein [Athelia psychrophila]|uniref:Thioredoxin-domain-containing protein n=1 Tax=Athelia psychrophila TaxID=1759441 RepID=A0A166CXM8_9AGAM|nr:thioredoxin-domain-containing protein [Fibularhizoctonia sp. CBS 109695]